MILFYKMLMIVAAVSPDGCKYMHSFMQKSLALFINHKIDPLKKRITCLNERVKRLL